jgi:hypothetical protein
MRALLFWLLPALALAQAIPPSAPAATAVKAADLRTSATLTLYVDPTGSDANACTATGAAACQTIAGALAKVPSELCDSVTINIASGNYTGFYIDRFRPCSLESGSRTGSLTLNGTLIPATLATGSGTFQFTSQTVGTSLGNTWGLLNNTAATWTVNDLRGKVLEASALSVLRIIASNTTTALTVVGPSSASANTSTSWAIEDWGTVITTGATFPGFPASTNFAGMVIGSVRKGASSPTLVTINKIKVSSAVPRCIYFGGEANVAFRLIRCETTGSGIDQVSSVFPVAGSLTDSVLKPGNARYGMSFDQVDAFTAQRVLFWGTPGFGLRVYTAREFNSLNNYFLNQALAGAVYGMVGFLAVKGDHHDTSSGTGCLAFGSTQQGFYAGFGYAAIDASDFQNCTGSAIYVQGPMTVLLTNTTGTTGNARYGLEIGNQARVIHSGNTVSGGLGDTAVGPTPTVTAWGSIGTGVSSTADFSRLTP